MIRTILLAAFAVAASFTAHGADGDVLRDIPSLREACRDPASAGRAFDISGTVLIYYRRPKTHEWIFTLKSGPDSYLFYEYNDSGTPAVNLENPRLGDRLRLRGVLYSYRGNSYAGYTRADLLAHRQPDEAEPTAARPRDLFNPACEGKILQVRGVIRDFFRDEGDPGFIYMALNCSGETAHAMILHPAEEPIDASRYIGAEAIAFGVSTSKAGALRQHLGRVLMVSGLDNVRIVRSSRPDGQSGIESIDSMEPASFLKTDSFRLHQAEGTVLAAWNHDQALIRSDAGNVIKAKFLEGDPPRVGQGVRIVGIPETDLYFINLVNATWEPLAKPDTPAPPARDISPGTLFANDEGYPQLKIKEHGETLRFSGIIRHLPQTHDASARFHVESDGRLIPVDASENPRILDGLELGCQIRVTGVCVIDIDSYGLGTSIPKAKGLFFVPRSPEDVVVLSRPPWWTPFRLLCVIGALLLVLAGILVWNTMLRRLAERRGRELAEEQVRSVTSELKVYERTHLAVELHDSLSQTLAGVSMQIDAVKRFAGTDPARMDQHLGIAAKTLKSCRDELRNCLLDLRSNALEESDMNAAIRKTLEPYLDDADIAIRFFIPREIFSDNTAHTVLRIVRELVVNALRHGRAGKIKIAGSVEGRTLRFSVRDNGRGFSPDSAPGIADGHFGLQGIRERIDELGGTFEVASTPGEGTKATVAIELPQDSTGGENA